MKKLVLESYETKIFVRVFLGFLTLFILIIASVLFSLIRGGTLKKSFFGMIAYLLFALILISLLVFSLKKLKEEAKKASLLAANTMFKKNRIVFPHELEFEYGRIEFSTYLNREHPRKRFKVLEKRKSSVFEFPDEEFKLVGDYDRGFASFPAIKILTKPYERAVILFMANKGVIADKSILTPRILEDALNVEVEARGKEIVGRFYNPTGKRRVDVVISVPESPEIAVKIADSSVQEFRYSLLPEERIVIFSTYESLSIANLLKCLDLSRIALGHGEFLLTFKLSKPKARELLTYKLKVELKEKGWGA
jgi:hypothetical protein